MRGSSMAMAAAVVVLVMISGPALCQDQWAALIPALSSHISSLWQNNRMEFMGSSCFYSQTPRIRSWELYYSGTFSCPEWTQIKGSALTRSRPGVVIKSIEDFLNKAMNNGLVTEKEAKDWLEGQNK